MIGVVFEHPVWLAPLFDALAARQIPFAKIDVSSFSFDLHATDILPLYLNRLSASSYQRGHQGAIALAFSYFTWLTSQGARVLNGTNAHLEVNKVAQMLALRQHGLATPRTWVFNSREQLASLPMDFPFPLLIKPSQGGAGSLIARFDSRKALLDGAHRLTFPPDQLMLAQEYIAPAGGYINRVEVLGGKLLYALQVYPTDNFNLCPADACDVGTEETSQAQFFLNESLDRAIITTIERLFTALELDYGSIEFLTGSDNIPYFYDINLNSNYRTNLPGIEHFDPWGQLADYLGAQLHAAYA